MIPLYWQYLDKVERFQRIEPCQFFMGVPKWQQTLWENWPYNARPNPDWRQDELYHSVSITRPFYVDRFLTTVYDFRRFVDATGYRTTAETDRLHNGAWGWGQRVGDELANDQYWNGGGNVLQIDNHLAIVNGLYYGFAERSGLFWHNVQWTYDCFGHTAFYRQQEDHPLVCVTRMDASAYLAWYNETFGPFYEPFLGFRPTFRLPTEAENECFSRGGSFYIYPWGDDLESAIRYANVADEALRILANYDWVRYFQFNPMAQAGSRKPFYLFTSPVGAFEPNNYGLYDVVGNVAEMVADVYKPDYGLGEDYNGEIVIDPRRDPNDEEMNNCNTLYVCKGGAWCGGPAASRLAHRVRRAAKFRSDYLGFRICFDVPEGFQQ